MGRGGFWKFMKIVFFGTPEYVLPILSTLKKSYDIAGVVTQKPQPAGRKKYITHSPVDKWAHEKKIPIFYSAEELISQNIEVDFGVLAAFGQIVPDSVIDHFPKGILNIHPSLLPKWRGASPVQATIVSGDKTTGVSIMLLDEKMDHGPIISQLKEEVLDHDTTDSLRKRLFKRSAEFLIDLIPNYLNGKIKPKPQDHSKATYTTTVKKEHGFIPSEYLTAALQGDSLQKRWKIGFIKNLTIYPTPSTIQQFIRAMEPWPIAWTRTKLRHAASPRRLKILKAHLENMKLVLDEVQLEGKNPVSWKQFEQGYPEVKF